MAAKPDNSKNEKHHWWNRKQTEQPQVNVVAARPVGAPMGVSAAAGVAASAGVAAGAPLVAGPLMAGRDGAAIPNQPEVVPQGRPLMPTGQGSGAGSSQNGRLSSGASVETTILSGTAVPQGQPVAPGQPLPPGQPVAPGQPFVVAQPIAPAAPGQPAFRGGAVPPHVANRPGVSAPVRPGMPQQVNVRPSGPGHPGQVVHPGGPVPPGQPGRPVAPGQPVPPGVRGQFGPGAGYVQVAPGQVVQGQVVRGGVPIGAVNPGLDARAAFNDNAEVSANFGDRIEKLIAAAVAESDAIRSDADTYAKHQVHDAQIEAERLVASAKRQAADTVASAQRRSEADLKSASEIRSQADEALRSAHAEAEETRRRARDEAAELRAEVDHHAQQLLARTHDETNRTLTHARAELADLQQRKAEAEAQLTSLQSMLSEAVAPNLPMGYADLLTVPAPPPHGGAAPLPRPRTTRIARQEPPGAAEAAVDQEGYEA